MSFLLAESLNLLLPLMQKLWNYIRVVWADDGLPNSV